MQVGLQRHLGIKDENGNYVCESMSSGLTDIFGHKYLSGTAKVLEDIVRNELGFKARGVELNVCQRAASHIASMCDLEESFETGKFAFKKALEGNTGKMIIIKRISDKPYKTEFSLFDISKIANAEKCVPDDYINEENNGVTQKMIDYLTPLIQGENDVIYENGVPLYLERQWFYEYR